jgi:hypothetical protein
LVETMAARHQSFLHRVDTNIDVIARLDRAIQ